MNQPITEYLRNKEAREQTPYTYLGWVGSGFYWSKDNVLSDEEMRKAYPLGTKIVSFDYNHKGDNPDKKRVI